MEQSLQDLCPDEAKDLPAILQQGREQLIEAVNFTKEQPGTEYMDLQGRKLVDAAIMLIVGHLFLRQSLAAPAWEDEFTTESVPVGGNGNGSDNQSEQSETLDAYRTVRRHKAIVARRYITGNANRIKMLSADITRYDRSSMTEYEEIVGQLP
ncbi:MAG: hypothetical protein KAJ52_10475, partial [Sedimentisphaerales bacterium]|nr:hypothetical protein [Sedimentisphaerales bacterium]